MSETKKPCQHKNVRLKGWAEWECKDCDEILPYHPSSFDYARWQLGIAFRNLWDSVSDLPLFRYFLSRPKGGKSDERKDPDGGA